MSQIVGFDQRMAQNQLPKLAIVGLGGQSRIVAETAKLSGWGSVHHFREPKLGLDKTYRTIVAVVISEALGSKT